MKCFHTTLRYSANRLSSPQSVTKRLSLHNSCIELPVGFCVYDIDLIWETHGTYMGVTWYIHGNDMGKSWMNVDIAIVSTVIYVIALFILVKMWYNVNIIHNHLNHTEHYSDYSPIHYS